jgi:uncharacterized protein (DUF58 family)
MSATDAKADEGVYVELDELVALRHSARHSSLLPRQPVNSLLAGRRASKLRGRGLDFEELRAYVAGDDVRSIDWRVTARTGRPYVRSYKEERDRPVLLVVDQRQSMFFGSRLAMKSVVAARFAALAAWRVASVGDRIGALVVGEQRQWALKPARSEASVLRLLELLVESGRALPAAQARGHDPFASALGELTRVAPHDSLVVLVSDLRGVSEEAAATLANVRRHNDLLVAWVVDPLESALPDVGLASVTDGDVELSLPTSDAQLRAEFAAAFAKDRARVAELCLRSGAPYFELSTARPVLEQVEQTFGRQRLPIGRSR